MTFGYKHTMKACYMAYVTAAIINNLAPLLFIVFLREFGLNLVQIGALVSVNFGVQMVVDFLCAKYMERIDYRKIIIAAHLFAMAGLIGLSVLPYVLGNPFAGLLAAVVLYAMGGGVIEVMISPTVESLPTEAKASAMSLLHSFYCWGHVAVILLTTLYFALAGIERWRYLPLLWAVVPLLTAAFFTKVPLNRFGAGHSVLSLGKLFSHRIFLVLLLMMICAGAAEQAVGQWASVFAETGLNVSKSVGDLLGPCLFAALMGVSRVYYGKFSEKIDLRQYIFFSGMLCIGGYLVVILSGNAVLSLIGCGISGLAVGIMWPGVLSLSAENFARGGTAMFALLALAGDIGCSIGPGLVGTVANAVSATDTGGLRFGFGVAIIFPLGLILAIILLDRVTAGSTDRNPA